jgi:hypothetical protein
VRSYPEEVKRRATPAVRFSGKTAPEDISMGISAAWTSNQESHRRELMQSPLITAGGKMPPDDHEGQNTY